MLRYFSIDFPDLKLENRIFVLCWILWLSLEFNSKDLINLNWNFSSLFLNIQPLSLHQDQKFVSSTTELLITTTTTLQGLVLNNFCSCIVSDHRKYLIDCLV